MNRLVLLLCVCSIALVAVAAEPTPPPADYEEGEKSAELITPEVAAKTAALFGDDDAKRFLHALRLQMTKYDNDMRSQTGRRNWHGKLLHQIIDTNSLTAVEVYTNEVDGSVWRYRMPFHPKPPKPPIPRPVATNGIPARLAAARVRAVADKAVTNSVTIEVTGNAPEGTK